MAREPVDYEKRKRICEQLFRSPPDHLRRLRELGMKPVASVTIENERLAVKCCSGAECDGKEPWVFAFVAEKWVVRVGSSAGKVRKTLRAYQTDINKRLRDLEAPHTRATRKWEAKLWKHIYGVLTKEPGQVWARQLKPIEGPRAEIMRNLADDFRSPGLRVPVLNNFRPVKQT